ncbi:MAG: SHOCT domain-containing protein [Anaerolineales bacterium]|nr:SHOCT domain-containing protein [Anaerolineales bacterium]
MPPLFTMKGVQGVLELYEDKVTITPKGLLGAINQGLKGTKTIPFSSITAIQFKKSGILSGYLQFTLPGGTESRGGVLDATKDENSFIFAGGKANEEAEKVKAYIEKQIQILRNPVTPKQEPASLSSELEKLADLKNKGIISDEEFQAAKKRLIG